MSELEFFGFAEKLFSSGRLREATHFYDLAERAAHDPDACAGARWNCHMLLGAFERAWQESDAIARRGTPDPERFWDGQPLDGRRVLIRCLHGLGDTIQFIRFAPCVAKRAASVSIEAQPRLKKLLAASQLAETVITWGDPEPVWDQQIEVMELPWIFRAIPETIPKRIPYIDVPWAPMIPQYDGHRPLRVGLVWTAGDFNPARSIPIQDLEPLLDIEGVAFYNLQGGEERRALTTLRPDVPELFVESDSVVPTACDIKMLDLVITVDTMTAHLAGAMGRPVWTLLTFASDWRWMRERDDSPWYPTMRLFRQPAPGDWRCVIADVRRHLQAAVGRYSDAAGSVASTAGRVK